MKQQHMVPIIFTIALVVILGFLFFKPEQSMSKEDRLDAELAAIEQSGANKEEAVVIRLDTIPKEWQQVIETCEEKPEGIIRDRCLYNRALDYNETSMCYAMASAEWQGKCFRGIAINIDDMRLCNVITHEYQQKRCISFFGRKYQDPALCNQIDDASLRKVCLDFQ